MKNLLRLMYSAINCNLKHEQLTKINNIHAILQKNRVTPLFYYAIEKNKTNIISSDELTKLKNETIALGVISFHQELAFNVLANKFNEANIRLIAFKGIVLKNLYPKKEMRAMGDIDLIVDKEDYPKARKLILEDLKYKLDHEDHSELCATNAQNITIELHQQLVTELSNNQQYFYDTYQKHIVKEKNYYVFDINYHFIYMIDHIYKHFIDGGLGLKYIYDFAVYVEKYPNVIKDSLNELEKLGLSNITLGFIQICNDYLGAEFSEQLALFKNRINNEALDTLLEIMMQYGEYGTVESRVNAKNVHGTFFKRMKKRLFPIVIRPCANKKWKVLNAIKDILIYPFRLIFYWIRFVFGNFKYIKTVFKNYSSLDKETKDNLSNMYDELK